MDNERAVLRCHTCNNVQRDRRSRDHLLRAHGKVSRRGYDVPVRLQKRKLAVVWASVRRHQVSGTTCASRRREELALPRVSDCAAERRLKDNRARTPRRHRAAARARGAATAALGAPEAQATTVVQGAEPMEPEERFVTQKGSSRSRPQVEPVIALRGGGPRRPFSPCHRCLNCGCRQGRD